MISITPLICLTIILIVILILLVSNYKLYKKVGRKGWESLIPIYNYIVLIKVVGLPTWYIFLCFIPIVNLYAMVKINIVLAHNFGKSTLFGILMAFFPMICIPVLVFGNATYKDFSKELNQNEKLVQEEPVSTELNQDIVKTEENEILDAKNINETKAVNINIVPTDKKICPKCGNNIDIDDAMCFMCGHHF